MFSIKKIFLNVISGGRFNKFETSSENQILTKINSVSKLLLQNYENGFRVCKKYSDEIDTFLNENLQLLRIEATKDIYVNETFLREAEIHVNQVFRSRHHDFYLSEYYKTPSAFDYLPSEIRDVLERITNNLLLKIDVNNQLIKKIVSNDNFLSKIYFDKTSRIQFQNLSKDLKLKLAKNEKLLSISYKTWVAENTTILPELNALREELILLERQYLLTPKSSAEIDIKNQNIYLKAIAFADEIVADFVEKGNVKNNELDKYRLEIPIELKLSKNFTCVLRKYQAFGVKYFLQQKKILIGDEMGLGKTVQALAAIDHLFQSGLSHALVIVPASLIPNWFNECSQKTRYDTISLIGTDRKIHLEAWFKNGGIGLVSYTTFGIDVEEYLKSKYLKSMMIIADEAEYVKNPETKRSIAFHDLIEKVEYALLLTGTPLQNQVGEFRQLVRYLDSDLSNNLSNEPNTFREQVKPRYLRRNRIDVLHELPEKIENMEWVSLTEEEAKIHLYQLENIHFMQYRYLLTTQTESKKTRIFELIEEHLLNQDKILIFTFFKNVIDDLTAICKHPHIILHGGVSIEERQLRLDDFLNNSDKNIAFCQILAAGRGLNMQGANAVIIAEPQLNPALEDQAIARCYRMGQRKNVFVHRLICKDSVEEKYLAMNEEKRKSFIDYANESNTKNEYSEATESELHTAQAESIATLKKRLHLDAK